MGGYSDDEFEAETDVAVSPMPAPPQEKKKFPSPRKYWKQSPGSDDEGFDGADGNNADSVLEDICAPVEELIDTLAKTGDSFIAVNMEDTCKALDRELRKFCSEWKASHTDSLPDEVFTAHGLYINQPVSITDFRGMLDRMGICVSGASSDEKEMDTTVAYFMRSLLGMTGSSLGVNEIEDYFFPPRDIRSIELQVWGLLNGLGNEGSGVPVKAPALMRLIEANEEATLINVHGFRNFLRDQACSLTYTEASQCLMRFDADGDGAVTVADLQQVLSGSMPLSSSQEIADETARGRCGVFSSDVELPVHHVDSHSMPRPVYSSGGGLESDSGIKSDFRCDSLSLDSPSREDGGHNEERKNSSDAVSETNIIEETAGKAAGTSGGHDDEYLHFHPTGLANPNRTSSENIPVSPEHNFSIVTPSVTAEIQDESSSGYTAVDLLANTQESVEAPRVALHILPSPENESALIDGDTVGYVDSFPRDRDLLLASLHATEAGEGSVSNAGLPPPYDPMSSAPSHQAVVADAAEEDVVLDDDLQTLISVNDIDMKQPVSPPKLDASSFTLTIATAVSQPSRSATKRSEVMDHQPLYRPMRSYGETEYAVYVKEVRRRREATASPGKPPFSPSRADPSIYSPLSRFETAEISLSPPNTPSPRGTRTLPTAQIALSSVFAARLSNSKRSSIGKTTVSRHAAYLGGSAARGDAESSNSRGIEATKVSRPKTSSTLINSTESFHLKLSPTIRSSKTSERGALSMSARREASPCLHKKGIHNCSTSQRSLIKGRDPGSSSPTMNFEETIKSCVSESEFSGKRANAFNNRISKVETDLENMKRDIENFSRVQISQLASQMESVRRSIEEKNLDKFFMKELRSFHNDTNQRYDNSSTKASRLDRDRSRSEAAFKRHLEAIEERLSNLDRKVVCGLRDLVNNKEYIDRDIKELKSILSRLSMDVRRRSVSAPRVAPSSTSKSPPRSRFNSKDPDLVSNTEHFKSGRLVAELSRRSASVPHIHRNDAPRTGAVIKKTSRGRSNPVPNSDPGEKLLSDHSSGSDLNKSLELPIAASNDLIFSDDSKIHERSPVGLAGDSIGSALSPRQALSRGPSPEVNADSGSRVNAIDSLPAWWAGLLARKRAAEERGARCGATM